MSIRVMAAVWDHSEAQGTTRLVLLALADHCDDHGIAWPSLDRIAWKCRISKSTVQRALDVLIDMGEVAKTRRGGTSNLYCVRLSTGGGQIDHSQNDTWSNRPVRGVTGDQLGRSLVTTEPSRTVKNRAARFSNDKSLPEPPPMPDPAELAERLAEVRKGLKRHPSNGRRKDELES